MKQLCKRCLHKYRGEVIHRKPYNVSFYRPRWEEGEGLPQDGKKTVEKTVVITVEKILVLIQDNPKITQKDLMIKTGLTRRGVEWNLKKLKDTGRLRRIGPDKGGHWEVS